MGVIEPSERAEGDGDEIEWDPAWDDEDEELDTAAAQIAEDEVYCMFQYHGWERGVSFG